MNEWTNSVKITGILLWTPKYQIKSDYNGIEKKEFCSFKILQFQNQFECDKPLEEMGFRKTFLFTTYNSEIVHMLQNEEKVCIVEVAGRLERNRANGTWYLIADNLNVIGRYHIEQTQEPSVTFVAKERK